MKTQHEIEKERGDKILSIAEDLGVATHSWEELKEIWIIGLENLPHDFPWPWSRVPIREALEWDEPAVTQEVNDWIDQEYVCLPSSGGEFYILEYDLEECEEHLDEIGELP